jgi:hypothetical protein
MQELVITDDYTVKPYPGGQEGFLGDWEHYLVGLEGGWFGGKSYIGAAKLIQLHISNAFDYDDEATFCTSLVCAPTFTDVMSYDAPHLYDHLDKAGIDYIFHSYGPIRGRYSGPAIEIPDFGTRKNPSLILLRSAEKPQRITGFSVAAAWGDEPARWRADQFNPMMNPFTQIMGRVRHPNAEDDGVFCQIMYTYTNEGDTTEVYRVFHDDNPDAALYRIRTVDNPAAKEFFERNAKQLTKELAEQYLEGKATNLKGGNVYSCFDESLHKDNTIELRKGLPIQVSFDFNIAPGMHVEVGQYHGDLDLFTTVHEIHEPRMNVEGSIDALVSLLKELKIPWDYGTGNGHFPLEIYGDATGGSEWAGRGESCIDILEHRLNYHKIPYRLKFPTSNPRVIDRINTVNCALLDAGAEIHWKIHPRCARLITDLKKLRRNEYGEIDKTEKRLSHASDADGYRIYFVRPIRRDRPTVVAGRFSVI